MLPLELLENNPKSIDNNKPSILLVHGMWGGAWCWEPYFLPYLEELGYKTYAVSLSNHGNSPNRKIFNLLRINDYVNDLKETIDRIGGSPILVGHSMGGFVVQKYLENHKATGAILLAPVPPFGVWGGTINVLKKFPLAFLKGNVLLNLIHIVNSPERFKHILGSDNVEDKDIEEGLEKICSESMLAYIDMLGMNLVKPKKIDSPLLAIRGSADYAVPEKVFNKTCEQYGIPPVTFEGMGHNLMIEPAYKMVVDKMVEWVAGLD